MSSAPIGIFDSGVGGLTVARAILDQLPNESTIYIGDTARGPYGPRPLAEVRDFALATIDFLVEQGVKAVVIACNTASTIALAHVRSALDLPVVGTVPAVKPAALLSKARVIGVLGTEATVRQPYVDNLVAEFASDCRVLRHGSADLVDMAEAKLRGEPPSPDAMRRVLDGLYSQPGGDQIDAVVLACTHFPLLAREISAASPPNVALVDSGEGIARRTAHLTKGQDWPTLPTGRAVFSKQEDWAKALKPALDAYGLTKIDYL